MTLEQFHELVSKLVGQGKNYLEAIKMAQNTGLFDNSVLDAFWNDFNERRKAQ